jgi:outer membrane protein assembly factor BamB
MHLPFLRQARVLAGAACALALQLAIALPASAATTLLGTTKVTSTADYNPAGTAEAFSAVASASGVATQLTIYIAANNAATQVVLGIYSDAGGHPGSALAQATLSSPTSKAWNAVAIPPVTLVQGQTYWLALLSPAGNGTVRIRDTAGGSASETSASTTLFSLPTAWSTGTVYADGPVSMAATANPGGNPVLIVSPPGISMHAFVGGPNPAPASLSVANGGSGTLSFTASTDQPWLGVTPGSGSAPATETVTASVAGLAAGTYAGNVTITAPGASGSPAVVPVALTVDIAADTGRDWPTVGQNVSRTSFAANDHVLDHTNIAGLRLAWSANLDGKVTAQPLFLGGVTIGGVVRDAVIVASNKNSLYAFDADTGASLWHIKLGQDVGGSWSVPGGMGIRSAPAVDRAKNRLYVVSDNGKLHTISLADGTETHKALQLIDLPLTNKVRGGLNLFNNTLYGANGSDSGDEVPWRGRVYRLDVSGAGPVLTTTLDVLPGVSGDNRGGGIWSYGGVSIDPATGIVYAATGADWQGLYTPNARTVMAMTPTLSMIGTYTPPVPNSFSCDAEPCDVDFSATPTVFTPTGCPKMVAAGNKDGTLYVLRTQDFAANTPLWQSIVVNTADDALKHGGLGGIPAWWAAGNMLFVTDSGTGNDDIPAGVIALTVSPAPACQLSVAWTQPLPNLGSTQSSPTVVGDVVLVGEGATGEVHAYYAVDGTELWNSGSTVTGDTFAAPSVGAGKVFVGSWVGQAATDKGVLRVFALPASAQVRGARVAH